MTSQRRKRPSRKRNSNGIKNGKNDALEVCTGDSTTTSSISSDVSTCSTPSIDTTEAAPAPSLSFTNSNSTAIIKNDDNSDAVLRIPFNAISIGGGSGATSRSGTGTQAWTFATRGNNTSQTTTLIKEDSKNDEASSHERDPTTSYDFIGPSSAMKNLFSLPYAQDKDGDVTVAVHNLGNGTLLLDDGEFPSLLQSMETAQNDEIASKEGGSAQLQLSPKLLLEQERRRSNTERENNTLALPPSLALDALSNALTDVAKSGKLKPKSIRQNVQKAILQCQSLGQNDTDTMSDVAAVTIPKYQQTLPFKFHEMNMLLSSDNIIVRPPPTDSCANESNKFCRPTKDQPSASQHPSQSVSVKVAEISDIRDQVETYQNHLNEAEKNKFSYAQIAAKNIDYMLKSVSSPVEMTNTNRTAAHVMESSDQKQQPGNFDEESANATFSMVQPVVSHYVSHDQLQSYVLPQPPLDSSSSSRVKSDVAMRFSQCSAPVSTSAMSPVMTCLDAYLDNILSNVPQLALCLAEKGFVQAVKLLRTEDIPSNMIHSSTVDMASPVTSSQIPTPQQATINPNKKQSAPPLFNPLTVDMNARMLLRYLKQHCSSPNSTYLLHRSGRIREGEGKDPDSEAGQAIHLYDITALSQKRQRQWTWWLAMMSYKFALSLQTHLKSSDDVDAPNTNNSSFFSPAVQRELRNRQRSLLTTSLELLEEIGDMDGAKHETISATLNEHLANTFLWNSQPSSTDSPGGSDCDVPNKSKKEDREPVTYRTATFISAAPISATPVIVDNPVSKTLDKNLPYKDISLDGLSKAQKYLSNAINILEPVLKNAKKRKRKGDNDESSSSVETQAIEGQLFKLHGKLVHVSLRLTARNFDKYLSSSIMQSIRLSARHLAKSAELLDSILEASCEQMPSGHREGIPPLSGKRPSLITNGEAVEAPAEIDSGIPANSSSKTKSKDIGEVMTSSASSTKIYSEKEQELVDSLLTRYKWLWQLCGMFTRLFSGDRYWRDKGYISGEDVVALLQNVENECCKWHHKFVPGSATPATRTFDENASVASRESESCRGSVASLQDRIGECFNFEETLQYAGPSCGITLDRVPRLSLSNLDTLLYDPPPTRDEIFVGKEAAECFIKTRTVMKRERELVISAGLICYQKANLPNLLGDMCNEMSKMLLHSARDLASVTSTCPCSIAGRQNLRTNFSREKGLDEDVCEIQCTECLLQSTELLLLTGLYNFSKEKSPLNAKNMALIRCNLSQCYKIRATSGRFLPTASAIQTQTPEDSKVERWLQKSIDYLQAAHTELVERNPDNSQIWDFVSDELAATYLLLGVRRRQMLLGSGTTPVVAQSLRLNPGKERSILHPMEQSLTIYEGLANDGQAAAVHYQMALYFAKIWTCQRDETKTRDKLSCAFQHFSAAHKYFFNEMRGNEANFVLLTLDLSNLYSMVSGPDCLSKALSCCFDTVYAFSPNAVQAALTRRAEMPANATSEEKNAWFEKMKPLATNVENRIMTLLVLLVKMEKEASSMVQTGDRFKDMYRVALTTKMATAAAGKSGKEMKGDTSDVSTPIETSVDGLDAGTTFDVHGLLTAVKECYDKYYPMKTS